MTTGVLDGAAWTDPDEMDRRWPTILAAVALAACALTGPLAVFTSVYSIPFYSPNIGAVGAAIAVGAGLQALVHHMRRDTRTGTATRWLILYSLIVMVSSIYNSQHARGAFIFPFLAIAVAGRPLDLTILLKSLRAICFLVTGLSLYWMYANLTGAFFHDNGRTLWGYQQLAGISPHPNVLGPVAALGIGVELARRGRPSPLSIVRLGTSVSVCALAQSHDGWALAGILTLAWFLRRKDGRTGGKGNGPRRGRQALLAIGIAWVVAEHRTGHLAIENWGTLLNGRQQLWALAIKQFYAHPILGGGPGVFGLGFRTTNGDLGTRVGEAHNQVIETLAEAGILGAIALGLALLTLIRPARQAWREGNWLPGGMLVASAVYFTVEAPMRPGLLLPMFWVLSMFALANATAGSGQPTGSALGGELDAGRDPVHVASHT